jgi:hypothetical protein
MNSKVDSTISMHYIEEKIQNDIDTILRYDKLKNIILYTYS